MCSISQMDDTKSHYRICRDTDDNTNQCYFMLTTLEATVRYFDVRRSNIMVSMLVCKEYIVSTAIHLQWPKVCKKRKCTTHLKNNVRTH